MVKKDTRLSSHPNTKFLPISALAMVIIILEIQYSVHSDGDIFCRRNFAKFFFSFILKINNKFESVGKK
jgi:hypothetical protein